MRSTRLLVVVDENKASKRAVSYVAQMVGRRRGFKVCLVHTLSEIPASLIEYGGARSPEEEERLDGELHAEQKHWVLAAQEKAQPTLTRATAVLRKGGLAANAIEERFCFPADARARVEEILDLARRHKYHTVVTFPGSFTHLFWTSPRKSHHLPRRGGGQVERQSGSNVVG